VFKTPVACFESEDGGRKGGGGEDGGGMFDSSREMVKERGSSLLDMIQLSRSQVCRGVYV